MDVFWIVTLFVLGACVGSFLNVVIYRVPRGESIVFPGSHCPACGRPIRWFDNLPILSWLLLRAKCRDCNAPISPRYLVIELATAVLVSGLYVCYFVLDVRGHAGELMTDWPMFLAHAALLCGLLAASVVDAELWLVPLEVLWVCSVIGIASAGLAPHSFMPTVPPIAVAMSFAALVGLGIAVALTHAGYLRQSFADAEPAPPAPSQEGEKSGGKEPKAVAFTKEHGINPRKEVLWEVLFLAPAALLAIGAWALLRHSPSANAAWAALFDAGRHPHLAPRMAGAGAAAFGYLVGGLWIWGVRILGTLGFGKEAMGLGDVHIMAAVGAVTGWIVPSIAFFVAPFFGLAWAAALAIGRGQRELPYGPWLAAASVVVMVFYDKLVWLLEPYAETFRGIFAG